MAWSHLNKREGGKKKYQRLLPIQPVSCPPPPLHRCMYHNKALAQSIHFKKNHTTMHTRPLWCVGKVCVCVRMHKQISKWVFKVSVWVLGPARQHHCCPYKKKRSIPWPFDTQTIQRSIPYFSEPLFSAGYLTALHGFCDTPLTRAVWLIRIDSVEKV